MTGPLVVTDSSVLIGLDRIGGLGVLPTTYRDLASPPAVAAEFGAVPEWLRVVAPADASLAAALSLHKLDADECEAIALARENAGSLLLIDERRGRRYALAVGLRITGTVGVLVQAKQAGHIEAICPLLDALRARDFRLSAPVYRQALAAVGESV